MGVCLYKSIHTNALIDIWKWGAARHSNFYIVKSGAPVCKTIPIRCRNMSGGESFG